jgi:hypothetical protein
MMLSLMVLQMILGTGCIAIGLLVGWIDTLAMCISEGMWSWDVVCVIRGKGAVVVGFGFGGCAGLSRSCHSCLLLVLSISP